MYFKIRQDVLIDFLENNAFDDDNDEEDEIEGNLQTR